MKRNRGARWAVVVVTAALAGLGAAGPVLACAGLVTPSGNVRLVRTATLAAWNAGEEHYVTAFNFTGGGAEVGSIVPLPAVPSKVERGGDWTLQRLEREAKRPARPAVAAGRPAAAAASPAPAQVVYETRIDALDITVLTGGGQAVADWAREHGFSLTPDAPEVLEFYARRSRVFMAARFDAKAAQEQNQRQGEGTPIHLTMPLDNPWVPLRILGLGKPAEEFINAEVYLLTPERPAIMPEPTGKFVFSQGEQPPTGPGSGLFRGSDEPASKQLLDDLRSDKGMEWIPEQMWFSSLLINENAGELRHDLALDVTPGRQPSWRMAGLDGPPAPATTTTTAPPPPTTTTRPPPPPPPTTATTAAALPPPPPPVEAAELAPAPVLPEVPRSEEAAAAPVRRDDGTAGSLAVAGLIGAAVGAGLVATALRRRSRSVP